MRQDKRLLRDTGRREAFCAVRSYLQTARKHGLGGLDVLVRLFKGDRGCRHQPSPAMEAPALPVTQGGPLSPARKADPDLDSLIDEITVDAYGEDEQLQGFVNAFDEDANFPCPGAVIGRRRSAVRIGQKPPP